MEKIIIEKVSKHADASFDKGQIIGAKVKKTIKKSSIFIGVLILSILASVFFFLYGFIDHKYKQPL